MGAGFANDGALLKVHDLERSLSFGLVQHNWIGDAGSTAAAYARMMSN